MRDEQPPDPWIDQPLAAPYESHHRSAGYDEMTAAAPPTGTPADEGRDGGGSWWDRLPFTPKIAAITAGMLLLCWGGFGLVGLFTDAPTSRAEAPSGDVSTYAEEVPDGDAVPPDGTGTDLPAGPSGSPTTGSATPTAGPGAATTGPGVATTGPGVATTGPAVTAAGTPTRAPVVETRTVTETEAIPFSTQTVKDNSLPKGTQTVVTSGVPGVRTLTYKLTFTDGVQTAKDLVSSVVTTEPVTEVVAVGTMPDSRCDPNYSGCVPIASDVDCAGAGDGPAYLYSPVDVIGTDIYNLDPDENGVACG